MKKRTPQTRGQKNTDDSVTAVYADLEKRPRINQCIRLTECCRFQRTGRMPLLTLGEAIEAVRALRQTGRKEIPESPDGSCPLLDRRSGRCLIYQSRPFGCRTHFCEQAGGPYDRKEVIDLIRRLEEIDASLGGDGSHLLPQAIRNAINLLR